MGNGTVEFLGNSFADRDTRVSLVLSGGADLAVFFQLGAINILHDHMGMVREELFMIAGGSGGSISGLLTAGGINSDKPSLVPSVKQVLRSNKENKHEAEQFGIYSQDGVVEHLEQMLGPEYAHFQDLPVDLRIASTMIYPYPKKVIFSKHNHRFRGREITTYEAVKCSITVPVLYTPVKIGRGPVNTSYHLDGEIIQPTPLEEAKDSDVIVMISVYGPFNGYIPIMNLPCWLENKYNKIRKKEMNRRVKRILSYNPDVKILLIENSPDDYDTATFQKFSMRDVEQLKAAGRHAAWKVDPYKFE